MELAIERFEKSFFSEGGSLVFRLSFPGIRLGGGESTFVMGHNGSGKSVLLNVLCGFMEPDSGGLEVALDGTAVLKRPEVVSRVPQDPDEILASELTVCENLALRLSVNGLSGRLMPLRVTRARLASRLAGHSTLAGKCEEPVTALSVGQRQRLAFLCATVAEQPVLVLDEYLAAADQDTSRSLRQLAREHAQLKGAVVLVVSHDVTVALEDASRILVLSQGNVTHDLRRGEERWNRQFLRGVI